MRSFLAISLMVIGCGDNLGTGEDTGDHDTNTAGVDNSGEVINKLIPQICAAHSWPSVFAQDKNLDLRAVQTQQGAAIFSVGRSGSSLYGFVVDARGLIIGDANGTKVLDGNFTNISATEIDGRLVVAALDGSKIFVNMVSDDLTEARLLGTMSGTMLGDTLMMHAREHYVSVAGSPSGIVTSTFDSNWTDMGSELIEHSSPLSMTSTHYGNDAMIAWSTPGDCHLSRVAAETHDMQNFPCRNNRIAANFATKSGHMVFEENGAIHRSTIIVGEVLARATPGFSGADLEFLVNEAALIAARRDKDKVEMEDFEDAKDKVLMGAERRSMIISDKEKRTTAVHEAGHALVARFVGEEADPVHKVTIIPRGRALGVTHQLPPEDRLNMTAVFATNQIAIMMGGRVAEEIVFGHKTTGAGNDIERATELARSMVTEWGMSDEFGPLNFSSGKQEVFLGRDFSSNSQLSEDTSRRIDAEIRRIVTGQYQRATEILTAHRKELEIVSEALLEHETLDGNDIDTLLRGEKIDRPIAATKKKAKADEAEKDEDRAKRPSILPPLGKKPSPEPA